MLITGPRDWTNREKLELELAKEQTNIRTVFIIGDCPTGVDHMALEFVLGTHAEYERYEVFRSALRHDAVEAFHARNQRMVTLGKPTRFVAFWDGTRHVSEPDGTLDTFRRCVRAKVPGRIVPP